MLIMLVYAKILILFQRVVYMKILVLGSGMMGSALAYDLKTSGYEPLIVDLEKKRAKSVAKSIDTPYAIADVSDQKAIKPKQHQGIERGREEMKGAKCAHGAATEAEQRREQREPPIHRSKDEVEEQRDCDIGRDRDWIRQRPHVGRDEGQRTRDDGHHVEAARKSRIQLWRRVDAAKGHFGSLRSSTGLTHSVLRAVTS